MEITKAMVQIAKAMKVDFSLNSRIIPPQEAFSDVGLLPAMVRRADQLASLCLGYGLGATYEEASESLIGVRVAFDDLTPTILRLVCITDVVYELMKASPSLKTVRLDELLYD